MKQNENLEYKLLPIGSTIINNGETYMVIGHSFGVANSKNHFGLPLNDIDRRIIEYAKHNSDSITGLEYHGEDAFEDGPIHLCNEDCENLGTDLINYIDSTIDKINEFSDKHQNKWDRESYLLGFYRPFHYHTEWGIFLKATGQIRRAARLKQSIELNSRRYGNPTFEACYLISKTFTYFHEFYHHKIESLALKFELVTRQSYYTKGFHCLYCKTFETDRCLEEAFAHTYAFFETYERLYEFREELGINPKQLRHILKELIIRNSPPGYRLAEKIISAYSREEAKFFEYHFFEALLRYSAMNNGVDSFKDLPDETYWKFFKHATHPILFFENEVTYVIDFDETTKLKYKVF